MRKIKRKGDENSLGKSLKQFAAMVAVSKIVTAPFTALLQCSISTVHAIFLCFPRSRP